MCEVTTLGAYGSRSSKGGSSAFLLDSSRVIDAGHLLDPLQEQSCQIEEVWLTHSHLDHIVDIAYILDNYFQQRTKTLRLRGLPQTLHTLRQHFFNHEIWPDFSTIPLASGVMALSYEPIELHQCYTIGEGRTIEAYPTDHTVPSCGYILTHANRTLLLTADTYALASTLAMCEANPTLTALVVECSFPSAMEALAFASKHLTPKLLFEGLRPLEGRGLTLYINHLKPAYESQLRQEIAQMAGGWSPIVLHDGDCIVF